MDRTISAEMLRLAEHARAVARRAEARWRALEYRGDWAEAVAMRRLERRMLASGERFAREAREVSSAAHSVE
ncbi:hypothetical protein [Marichromatium sp. AB31]|uniref:hypothetical protein n=1 Tax=Marichromatium sp. AB31 TaxID=2483362 RepID=UPI000F3EE879|nr:hypothetical protein [Marichromatium sp. AB31]RNE89857.1 hypothetical protein EBL84_09215 [Marichromatium sp. AB31]